MTENTILFHYRGLYSRAFHAHKAYTAKFRSLSDESGVDMDLMSNPLAVNEAILEDGRRYLNVLKRASANPQDVEEWLPDLQAEDAIHQENLEMQKCLALKEDLLLKYLEIIEACRQRHEAICKSNKSDATIAANTCL